MKKLLGKADIEDGLKRLDKLTNEEVRMVTAQVLKDTQNVNDRVRVVDNRVLDVDNRVAIVDDNVKAGAQLPSISHQENIFNPDGA